MENRSPLHEHILSALALVMITMIDESVAEYSVGSIGTTESVQVTGTKKDRSFDRLFVMSGKTSGQLVRLSLSRAGAVVRKRPEYGYSIRHSTGSARKVQVRCGLNPADPNLIFGIEERSRDSSWKRLSPSSRPRRPRGPRTGPLGLQTA